MKLKSFLLATTVVVSTYGFSQTLKPSSRSTSALSYKKLVSTDVTTKSTTPMGEMLQTNKSEMKANVSIAAATATGTTVETKIYAVKMSGTAMGESFSYDSEKPDEGDENIKEAANGMMKKPTIVSFDSKGLITEIKNTKNGVEGMEMQKGEANPFFLNIDKDVKPGDTWTVKNKAKDAETESVYTYKSFNNDMAVVELVVTLKLDGDIEQMGMKMHQTMQGKVTSTLTVDAKTLLIKKSSSTSSMNGDVEVSGQKMPVTMFSSTEESIID